MTTSHRDLTDICLHTLRLPVAGGLTLSGQSIAGLRSTIVIPELHLCFDLGVCSSLSVRQPLVLITHGHADHIGGLHMHSFERSSQRMPMPTTACRVRVLTCLTLLMMPTRRSTRTFPGRLERRKSLLRWWRGGFQQDEAVVSHRRSACSTTNNKSSRTKDSDDIGSSDSSTNDSVNTTSSGSSSGINDSVANTANSGSTGSEDSNNTANDSNDTSVSTANDGHVDRRYSWW